jgi:hypothetical protein
VFTSHYTGREALPWCWKAMGVLEIGILEQNDRTLCSGLSRSPQRAGTRPASEAAPAACVALLCIQFYNLTQPPGKLFLILLVPFSVWC